MKNLIVLLLLSLLCLEGYSNPSKCIIEGYSSAIGVREASGHNDGVAVEKYLASTGLEKGHAWCAAFVNYTLEACGIDTPRSAAWSPSWFPNSRVIYHRGQITYRHDQYQKPVSGDVFGIYFINKARIAHVGFIDDWPSGHKYVTTVEGNTNEAGSREGDGVYRKIRLKSQLYKVSRWTGVNT